MINKLNRAITFLIIISVTVSLVLFGEMTSLGAQKAKVIKVDDCTEIWMEQEVVNGDMLWTILAKNNCNRAITIDRIIKITEASNVSVDQGEEYDLKKFVVLANSTKVIMYIRKLQSNKRGHFKWKLIK